MLFDFRFCHLKRLPLGPEFPSGVSSLGMVAKSEAEMFPLGKQIRGKASLRG